MNERVKPLQLKFHDSFPFQLRTFPLYLASAPPKSAQELSNKSIVAGAVAMFAVLFVLLLSSFGTPQTYKLSQ